MIRISCNEEENMMAIYKDDVCVFGGNYWDFNGHPLDMKDFLEKLGLEVKLDTKLESIG